jgi:histidinol-phosphate/aromatic aminotransferase/cobyric acid decarboxylase-like protein
MLAAAKAHAAELGFVYVCNPNNPTGVIVPAADVRRLLDGLPAGVPVLIDEAYHHFVDDPTYASSLPYVAEGRPVIITRTFSKIAALAGMRLGYAIAAPPMIKRLKAYASSSVNAMVKWGGAAALKDAAHDATVKRDTIALRQKTITAVKTLGFDSIPSQANFFMIHIKRDVGPVIEAFRKEGVAVGRPFPPMTQHLRVSVGTAGDMDAFVAAFKKVFA